MAREKMSQEVGPTTFQTSLRVNLPLFHSLLCAPFENNLEMIFIGVTRFASFIHLSIILIYFFFSYLNSTKVLAQQSITRSSH